MRTRARPRRVYPQGYKATTFEPVWCIKPPKDHLRCHRQVETTIVWQVRLCSLEYGNETFTYDTKDEAWAGYERLVQKAQDYCDVDEIERWVTVPRAVRVELITL